MARDTSFEILGLSKFQIVGHFWRIAKCLDIKGSRKLKLSNDRLRMQHPRDQYPKPPFHKHPSLRLDWPDRWDPKPDHGEVSYVGNGRLAGRRALITGGDSAIGRAVAIAFAREGSNVVITHHPSEESDARQVLTLMEACGVKARSIPGDVTDEAFCNRLVSEAAAFLGGLDILVNNAGAQATQPVLADVTTEQIDKTLKTDLYALFWITKAAVALLARSAAIVNTASVQAYEPSESIADYAITKAGIVAFTKALSKQLIGSGVRVNAVAPGPFWTPLQSSGGQTQDKLEQFGGQVPLKRPG